MKDIKFKTEDVLLVAKALVEDAIEWDHGDPCARNAHDGYKCNYCFVEEQQTYANFPHESDCPVLIAQDLLVGSEWEL